MSEQKSNHGKKFSAVIRNMDFNAYRAYKLLSTDTDSINILTR